MATRNRGKKKGGTGLAAVGISIACALFIGSCASGPSPAETSRDKALVENASLKNELQNRDSLITGMALAFDDIEKNIEMMDDQQRVINSQTSEGELGHDKRERIVQKLQLVNGLMKDSRERIAELTKRLDKSKFESTGLRKKLKELDMRLASRDSSITSLKDELLAKDFKINQVNDQLSAIEMDVAMYEATIQQQEHELNKAYYAMGTFKELEDRGVLTKEGGVIGIGRKEALREDVATTEFKEVDKRDLKRIPLNNASKAVLVTEHPSKSYEMVEENDKFAYLDIKDPEEFWRLSKYMVVEVK